MLKQSTFEELKEFEDDIKECIQALDQTNSFLYPTDTIWGVGCDATNYRSVEKVQLLKGRSEEKSFVVLMSDVTMLRQHLANPLPNLEDFILGFTKPTTIVFNDIIGIASNVLAKDGSLGIRIPKDPFCIALIKRFRKPILSTSANFSGLPSPNNFSDISERLKSKVDYVVNWRQNDMVKSTPSAIIKLDDHGRKIIIR